MKRKCPICVDGMLPPNGDQLDWEKCGLCDGSGDLIVTIDALRARVAKLEAALLHIENGCGRAKTWEVEDHVRDVIEAVRCTARDALAAKDGEADGG